MKVFLIAALLVAVLTVAPGQAIQLSFEPSGQTRDIGDPVSVDVVVSGLETGAAPEIVSAYDLDVTWNPAILGFTSVTFGPSLGGPLDAVQQAVLTSGRLDFWEMSFLSDADLDALQGNSVVLVTLGFQALAAGTSPLTFDAVTFPGIDVKGSNAAVLALDVNGGSVTVRDGGSPPVPEPGTLFLLGAGMVGVICMRRRRR
jgi:hypothetical protein